MDNQQPPAYGEGGYPNKAYPNEPYPNQPYPNQLYPNQPYPQQPYPGQPGTAVVAGAPSHTVIVQQGVERPQSYMVFSCFVFWCVNWIFGGIAFIFSMLSSSAADNNDMEQARKMGRVSLWINVAGIIVSVIIGIVVIVLFVVYFNNVTDDATDDCPYYNSYYCK